MGSESEPEPMISTPRLPLFSNKSHYSHAHETGSPEQSGMLTPPHYTLASVPFRWEEEPGKPRECTADSTLSSPIDFQRCLELPPRLLIVDANSNITKLPSPTTVLEGPYIGKSRFQSSSFRIIKREFYGSFRKRSSSSEGDHTDEQLRHPLVKRGVKGKGFLGSWGGWGRKAFSKGKREVVGGGSYVFPSSVDREANSCYNEEEEEGEEEEEEEEESSGKKEKMTKIRRTGSFSTLSHSTKSQFWATIYEGLKQVVPWRTGKVKKDRFVI